MSTLYLELLALTVGIEALVAALLAPATSRGRTAATALCANLATHPLAALLLIGSVAPFAVLEFLVLVAETVAYRNVADLALRRSALIAIVANGASLTLAAIIG